MEGLTQQQKGEKFAELFPKPEASPEEKEIYEECIQAYEEHIDKYHKTGDGEEGGTNNILDQDEKSVSGAGSVSKGGGSGAGQSQVGLTDDQKAELKAAELKKKEE